MSRYLFVVPPLTGHVNPTVAVGRELRSRGHEVAWAAYPKLVSRLLDPGSQLIEVGEDLPDEMIAATRERATSLRGVAALEFLWSEFLRPLARAMVPGVEDAVDRFAPDVLVVDQQAFAGAIVARRRGLPWATSATTSAELVDPFHDLPKVGDWVRSQLLEMQADAGVDAASAARSDLRFSEHLVIAFTTEALAGPPVGLPAGTGEVVMVGPSIGARNVEDPAASAASTPFDWDWVRAGGDDPLVLVTLGTVNATAGARFFAAAAEAVSGRPWRAVFVAPPELVDSAPGNVLVRSFVPQLELLEHVSAVVCHAGHNTVCETLAAGAPLVVAPIRDDQPVVAEQVVAAGAGVRVRFGRVGPDQLAKAIDAVLSDPSFRQAAGRVRDSFEMAGGAATAAAHLERLAS